MLFAPPLLPGRRYSLIEPDRDKRLKTIKNINDVGVKKIPKDRMYNNNPRVLKKFDDTIRTNISEISTDLLLKFKMVALRF